MAHRLTVRENSYSRLSRRINLLPQGAPRSELLLQILKILFSEREAQLLSLLPVRPFNTAKAASAWKISIHEASSILNDLCDKGILLDAEHDNGFVYTMAPPMAGFFEFSLMRYRNDIDQKTLSQLFHQYINVEDAFVKDLFSPGETQVGRIFVDENALPEDNSLQVLDYERASEVIKTASHIGVGVCYCRHKMQHMGRNCDAPMEICMTFNGCAESLTRHGIARKTDASECLDLLQEARSNNLVQFGENVRDTVTFICNCCSCCCEALIAARRFGFLHPVHTTNFMPVINDSLCNGCGKCIALCPVEAMALVSSHDPGNHKGKKAKVQEDICLGCGICLSGCTRNSIRLKSRETRVITPVNSVHRVVMMAIERGKLHNLIFDQQVFTSHRAMAAILGTVLKMPPLKQIMATKQFRSRYLESLIRRYSTSIR